MEPPISHLTVRSLARALAGSLTRSSALRRQNIPCPDNNLYRLLDTLTSLDITISLAGKNCAIMNFTGYPNLKAFDMRGNKLTGTWHD